MSFFDAIAGAGIELKGALLSLGDVPAKVLPCST